jgi:PIN domain nuclease of toxin-antitoxin system
MLNLDTHIFIKALEAQLTPAEQRLLSRRPWGVSAIVLWELAMLGARGRIVLDIHSARFARTMSRVHVWPLDLRVCRAMKQLNISSDPADEIVAATSLIHDAPLVTRDRALRRSKVIPLASLRS